MTPDKLEHSDYLEGDTHSWTGDQDSVAAIALAVCLSLAALIFLVVAAGELHP